MAKMIEILWERSLVNSKIFFFGVIDIVIQLRYVIYDKRCIKERVAIFYNLIGVTWLCDGVSFNFVDRFNCKLSRGYNSSSRVI